MKIIISPAKKMKGKDLGITAKNWPIFQEQADVLGGLLKAMTYEELKKLLSCNDQIASQNYERYQNLGFKHQERIPGDLTPALLAYEGIQYQYMSPQVFSHKQWDYAEQNLRILSGFYGILSPLDAVSAYRLEMQARLVNQRGKSLYDFWGKKIYEELARDDKVIVNLASKEYSKAVEKYLEPEIRYVTCMFGTLVMEGSTPKVKVKGTLAKMARGEMVRWMSDHEIQQIEDLKKFQGLNYRYEEEYSSENELVFIQHKEQ